MSKTIFAVIGTYRKGHTIDLATSELLDAAQKEGAIVSKVYLLDKHLEFCTNCRACTEKTGKERGKCVIKDDLDSILDEVDKADSIILAAPVNFFNVNALTRRFMERLVCYAYWPWGKKSGPVARNKTLNKKAVLITSTAMPGFLIPIFTGAVRALKAAAKVIGAKTVGTICIGLSAVDEKQALSACTIKKARQLGKKLA